MTGLFCGRVMAVFCQIVALGVHGVTSKLAVLAQMVTRGLQGLPGREWSGHRIDTRSPGRSSPLR